MCLFVCVCHVESCNIHHESTGGLSCLPCCYCSCSWGSLFVLYQLGEYQSHFNHSKDRIKDNPIVTCNRTISNLKAAWELRHYGQRPNKKTNLPSNQSDIFAHLTIFCRIFSSKFPWLLFVLAEVSVRLRNKSLYFLISLLGISGEFDIQGRRQRLRRITLG